MIQLCSISKNYIAKNEHEVVALREVNLKVEPGQILVVIGPSGSGKSTLLFTMGGMLKPTSGEVKLGNVNIYDLSPVQRAVLRRDRVGFLFQTFNLIPYLSCLENVALPGLLAGRSSRAAMVRARELLELLGLGERLSHRPTELSVGERQRAALCRSLINDPEVLLADEPTGNLDPSIADEVMKLLLELNTHGQTIVIVSHDPKVAKLGNRVISLHDGKIQDEHLSYDKGLGE